MKQDSDIQLLLDFEADTDQTIVESKIGSSLRLIYSSSNQDNSLSSSCSKESTFLFSKQDEELFEPIINHARSLSW